MTYPHLHIMSPWPLCLEKWQRCWGIVAGQGISPGIIDTRVMSHRQRTAVQYSQTEPWSGLCLCGFAESWSLQSTSVNYAGSVQPVSLPQILIWEGKWICPVSEDPWGRWSECPLNHCSAFLHRVFNKSLLTHSQCLFLCASTEV